MEYKYGTQRVQRTGLAVTETVLLNAVAITDTAQHSSGAIDVSAQGGRKAIYIQNGLNEAVTATVLFSASATSPVTASFSMGTKSVAAGADVAITVADIPELADPTSHITVEVAAATAPTTGTISAILATA